MFCKEMCTNINHGLRILFYIVYSKFTVEMVQECMLQLSMKGFQANKDWIA